MEANFKRASYHCKDIKGTLDSILFYILLPVTQN